MAHSKRRPNRRHNQHHNESAHHKGSGFIRLISGQWRGRKLPVYDLAGLRPTTDRVKETLFNWLAREIPNARCLDLFAGSGSLGFEALSRYADYVLLLEKDNQVVKQLQQNLETLKVTKGEVIQADTLNYLSQTPKQGFDVVFIDPPFRQDLLIPACKQLEQFGWLNDHALIYVEREADSTPDGIPLNWELLKEKQAGQVCYQLYVRQMTV